MSTELNQIHRHNKPVSAPMPAADIAAWLESHTPFTAAQATRDHGYTARPLAGPFYVTEFADINQWTPAGPVLIAYGTELSPMSPHAAAALITQRLNNHV